jgi:transposase
MVRLTDAAAEIARRIGESVRLAAPTLLTVPGCGELTAAKIVAEVAGIERFKSEAAFARYIGVAPIPHWSDDAVGNLRSARHGNRQLNAAVHRIAVVQISKPGPGRDYFQRRRADGDTGQRALRSLKRRLTRVVYTQLKASRPPTGAAAQSDRTIPAVFMLPLADLDEGRRRRVSRR